MVKQRTAKRLLEVEKKMKNFVKILFRLLRLHLHWLVMQGSGDYDLFKSYTN